MYQIIVSDEFEKNLKKLSKKYPNIKKDLSFLLEQLEKGVFVGNRLQKVGNNIYKVRLWSSDQQKWKRWGFRSIYYVINKRNLVFLADIYAKTSQENITDKEVIRIIKRFNWE